MAKSFFLVSPFGELTLRLSPDHVVIEAADQRAGDWGLGWWHGRDHGDDAVFARAFWRGTLGQDPRPSVGRTETDEFIRPWGFSDDLGAETEELPAGLRSRVHAYTEGFNHSRHRRGKETPWTPEDCHLLARTLGFLEWWETRAPQMGFLLQAWQAGLSWSKVLNLWPGLGPEPDPAAWKSVTIPRPFSLEARSIINRLRRFRPSQATVVPAGRSANARPFLVGGYVSDVTEPGLPFVPVCIQTPSGTVHGLSRPGHPGFLSGRNGWLAWHASVAIDDTVDLRTVDHNAGVGIAGHWAGAGRTGTLAGLLLLEEAAHAEQAKERTQDLGSASLDFTAVDATGGTVRWAQGPRWVRQAPRDEWLPTPWGDPFPVTTRTPRAVPELEVGGKLSLSGVPALFTSVGTSWTEAMLATIRFLLPDTEEGRSLRRWTGTPGSPEAATFERLYVAILEAFWQSSPQVPALDSPVSQALSSAVDHLIQAAHSSWFPSSEKNHRLAEAVRLAFAPGRPAAPPVLARRAPKACWTENHGGKPRIFALTVAVVADPAEPTWGVFHTDDETEVVTFRMW